MKAGASGTCSPGTDGIWPRWEDGRPPAVLLVVVLHDHHGRRLCGSLPGRRVDDDIVHCLPAGDLVE